MDRFKIEDLVAQDKNGIIFRAKDSESGQVVAIRRFFPFGQNGGGLDKDEAVAYGSASECLAAVKHESLRSIVFGAVDPIDQIPYLVTEWVEGDSLNVILSNETMEPALVIDLLKIALEVSIAISHVLGEEAVWVETELDSIVVGTQESGRGFTFWISPFKWLGGQFESRKLSSIVTLGEELTGWKEKFVSDQAGYGLGGWLKWMKNNPDASLKEALESLASSTGGETPASEKALIPQANKSATPEFKHSSSKAPLLLTAAIAVVVIALAFFYFHKTAEVPPIIADYTEQKISDVIVETISNKSESSSPAKKSQPTPDPASAEAPLPIKKSKESEIARVNALAEKLARETVEATISQKQQEVEKGKLLATEKKSYEQRGGILTPYQFHLTRTFNTGTNVKLQGTLQSVRTSKSGKSIYLNFSDPYDLDLTNAVAHISNYKGDFKIGTFESFIGKQVIINGSIFIENARKTYYVKITSLDQLSITE